MPTSDPHLRPGHAIRIFLCGDVMTGRGVDQALAHPCDPELREAHMSSALDYLELAEHASGPIPRPVELDYVWGAALEELRTAAPDVRLVNLETAITRSADFAPKGINYRMAPENAGCLSAAGIDACSLANNHVLDFGPSGLLETLETLQDLGVGVTGAGRNLAEAGAPAVIPLPGKAARVIFLGAALEDSGVPPGWRAGPDQPGVNLVEPSREAARSLAARIAELRRPGDVAVVSIHWGSNWGYQVPEPHRRFAHALLDTGQVSIVHGRSSHHPRPIEIYRDRLVLYGCGDFLNDYEGIGGFEAYRGDLTAMYLADLDREGALLGLDLVPLRIRRLRLERAAPDEVRWVGETLARESHPFGVDLGAGAPAHLRATPRGRREDRASRVRFSA